MDLLALGKAFSSTFRVTLVFLSGASDPHPYSPSWQEALRCSSMGRAAIMVVPEDLAVGEVESRGVVGKSPFLFYLKGRVTERRRGKWRESAIHWFTPQMGATARAGLS